MRFSRTILLAGCVILACLQTGCILVPARRWAQLRQSNQELNALCKNQKSQLDMSYASNRKLQGRLDEAQEELAMIDRAFGSTDQQLREASAVLSDLRGGGAGGVSSASALRLRDFCEKTSSLDFDPTTGIAKSSVDLIFETGQAKLEPQGMAYLRNLVDHLRLSEAKDFRVMVVGHTDDRGVGGGPAGERYRDNFELSTARSNAVAAAMRDIGLSGERIGVAGFASYQPVAPNASPADREKNRRVELFVLPSEAPVVGWTDTIPTVYR